MKMTKVLLACAAMSVFATTVNASPLGFYFDTRTTIAASGCQLAGGANGGLEGDGATLYLQPQLPANGHIVNGDTSSGSLYLYMKVADRAGDDDVISSAGLDINVSSSAGTPLASISYAWGGNDSASWSGTNVASLSAKAVDVPVDGTPSFDSSTSHVPGADYNIGTVSAQCSCAFDGGGVLQAESTHSLRLSVNNLLVTRVYDPEGANFGSAEFPELIDFGYVGGAPEAANDDLTPDANPLDGDNEGLTSIAADGAVQCVIKGDVNGAGGIEFGDITPFGTIITNGPSNCRDLFVADMNNAGGVEFGDITPFGNRITNGLGGTTCP